MSCRMHRINDEQSDGRARVLCFQCYRARLDRPERVPVVVVPFPRALTERELLHRRRMLAHLYQIELTGLDRSRQRDSTRPS